MDIETLREYCLAKPGTSEHFPFDNKILVFKVVNKMYALVNVDDYQSVNLKCDPTRAIELREEYAAVTPGYHMSKIHWNTVFVYSDVNQQLLKELIDHSYDLVIHKLSKKEKAQLK